MDNRLIVHHWRFEDGWHDIPIILQKQGGPTREFIEGYAGWHCWVYTDLHLERWMKDNIHGNYDCTFRFNSGNPMHSVYIADKEDALFFALTWGIHEET